MGIKKKRVNKWTHNKKSAKKTAVKKMGVDKLGVEKKVLLILPKELLLLIAENEWDMNAFARLNRRCHHLLNLYLYRYHVKHNRVRALFWAAERGECNTAVQLLDQGADIHSTAAQWGLGLVTVLHVACHYRYHRLAAILIERGANTQLASDDGHTPLGLAIAGRSPEIVAMLIEHGADACQTFPAQWASSTALHLASYIGDISIVALLMENGADVEAVVVQMQTPLHWAVRLIMPESAMEFPYIYRRFGDFLRKRILRRTVETVKMLLDHGANAEVIPPDKFIILYGGVHRIYCRTRKIIQPPSYGGKINDQLKLAGCPGGSHT